MPVPGVAGGASSAGGGVGTGVGSGVGSGVGVGFGSALGTGFGLVPTRTIFGSERYEEYHVSSWSTAPLGERTMRVTAVVRDGCP